MRAIGRMPAEFLALTVSFAACHRDVRNSADNDGPATSLSEARSASAVEWRNRLEKSRLILTVGELDSDRRELVFGSVIAGRIVPNYGVIVLDEHFEEFRAFDFAGRLLTRFGHAGFGPGEFLSPAGFDVSGDSSVFLLERNGRVSRFAFWRGHASFRDGFRLETGRAEGICVIGDTVFIRGSDRSRDTDISALSYSGRRLLTFEPTPRHDSWIMRSQLASGNMVCNSREGLVASFRDHTATLSVYNPLGSLLHSDTIPGYVSPIIELLPDGGVRQSIPPDSEGVDQLLSICALDGGHFLVQVARMAFDRQALRARIVKRRSYVYDSDAGRFEAVMKDLPKILDVRDGLILSITDDPFPVFEVWNYGRDIQS